MLWKARKGERYCRKTDVLSMMEVLGRHHKIKGTTKSLPHLAKSPCTFPLAPTTCGSRDIHEGGYFNISTPCVGLTKHYPFWIS